MAGRTSLPDKPLRLRIDGHQRRAHPGDGGTDAPVRGRPPGRPTAGAEEILPQAKSGSRGTRADWPRGHPVRPTNSAAFPLVSQSKRHWALWLAALCLAPMSLCAQTAPDLAKILERLDRLEAENRALTEQVRALQAQLGTAAPPPPTTEERVDIQERRIEEQAQTKVEASQKFPIRLTGMALFNAFANSKQSGGSDYPVIAAPTGAGHSGATVRQTVVGLEFGAPQAIWGGKVSGSVYMDFFAGGTLFEMRMRTASIGIDWKDRRAVAGLGKPIFNPRAPRSLAQVVAGQTRESGPYAGTVTPESARPAAEGRLNFYHKLDDARRMEIAAGFHTSTTHAGGYSLPSDLFAMDWFFNPWKPVEFSGVFYTGENVAHLGSGTKQGFAVYKHYAEAVGSRGGWGQLTLHTPLPRLDFHLFTGQVDDANHDLTVGSIGKNLLFGGNAYFRLAPNVLMGLEASQVRTMYLGQGVRINNHYDLALADRKSVVQGK